MQLRGLHDAKPDTESHTRTNTASHTRTNTESYARTHTESYAGTNTASDTITDADQHDRHTEWHNVESNTSAKHHP